MKTNCTEEVIFVEGDIYLTNKYTLVGSVVEEAIFILKMKYAEKPEVYFENDIGKRTEIC